MPLGDLSIMIVQLCSAYRALLIIHNRVWSGVDRQAGAEKCFLGASGASLRDHPSQPHGVCFL